MEFCTFILYNQERDTICINKQKVISGYLRHCSQLLKVGTEQERDSDKLLEKSDLKVFFLINITVDDGIPIKALYQSVPPLCLS